VQQYDDNSINSNSNKSDNDNQIKFHNVAINDGRSSATHLRLSISYPNYNITSYRTIESEIVIGVIVDVTRFCILVFLVPRFTMRSQLQIKMH
jgi:hypothetical protein